VVDGADRPVVRAAAADPGGSDRDAEIRLAAAWALGELEDKAALPALRAALARETDDQARKAELRALVHAGEEPEQLSDLLKSQDPEVRKTAIRGIAGQQGNGSVALAAAASAAISLIERRGAAERSRLGAQPVTTLRQRGTTRAPVRRLTWRWPLQLRSWFPVVLALSAFGCGVNHDIAGPHTDALSANVLAAPLTAGSNGPGAVYTMTNGSAGNAVLAFTRAANGTLGSPQSFATGGLGTGAGLGNQGGLALSQNSRWLFAVNAGSDDVSAFRVSPIGLALTDREPSGGSHPISITTRGDLLYVLNAGERAACRASTSATTARCTRSRALRGRSAAARRARRRSASRPMASI
jgi:hypothetical protein